MNYSPIAPEIDGYIERLWDAVIPISIEKNLYTEAPTVTATWQALYDNNNFYVVIYVADNDHWPAWASGGNAWEYDRPEVYWDVNSELKDGKGIATASSGHYQLSPGFEEVKYDWVQTEACSTQSPGGTYAYSLVGEGYVYEMMIPWSNFMDENSTILNETIASSRLIGFDITIVDQDKGITTSRQRAVWMQDGKSGVADESWNNMDGAGTIKLIRRNLNHLPIANAGPDQSVNELVVVTLDGSASSNPDGDTVSYKWTAPTGITLSSTTVAKPTFTAPDVAENTNYIFSLVVNDGENDSQTDQVVITVNRVNNLPVVSVDAVTFISFDGIADPIAITSSEAGTVYLARDDITANTASLFAAIAQHKAVAAILTVAGSVNIDAEGLKAGTFKAYAIDAYGQIGVASNVVTVLYSIPNPLRMIRQIQGETTESPFVGNKVIVIGIVTAITSSGFYMQDDNKPWSGIFVNSTEAATVGSSVEVTGTVSEVDGLTVIGAESIIPVAPLIELTSLTIEPEIAMSEMYEGVFVKISGRPITGGKVTTDWTISSATGTNYSINNELVGASTILQDYNYVVTGIGIQSDTVYKVLATDIENQSIMNGKLDLLNAIKIFPNPFERYISLSVTNDIVITKAVIANITGQLVKEVINPKNKISTSELSNGIYFLNLQTQDGTIKTERILKVDNE